MAKDINTIIKKLVDDLERRFGKGAVMPLSDDLKTHKISVIQSGSIALDHALGVGGYPRGRIVEIFGPESSGKTTLCLHAIAQAQATGGAAAFIDAEHAFDPAYAKAIGVDLKSLLLAQPDSGEQGLDICEALARSGAIDVVVIDSVAALTPQAEIDGEMGDQQMGLHARLMGKALRKLTSVAFKSSTTLIFVNQLRQKIGVVFGNPETTTGGNALKFYASVRVDVRRLSTIKSSDELVGSRTRAKVIKNKCAPPFRTAEFDIRWGTGIDAATDLIEQAVDSGVITKRGAYLSFNGESLGQGRERARDALLSTDTLAGEIRQAVVKQQQTSQAAIAS
jgi:recombination protein RecA